MNFFMIWETALKSVVKNTRRSLLTMLGIIIGIAAVITIVSVGRSYEKYQTEKMLGSDGETIKTSVTFSPKDISVETSNLTYYSQLDMTKVKKIPGVVSVELEQEDGAQIYRSKDFTKNGYSKSTKFQLISGSGRSIIQGRRLNEADQVNNNRVIVISQFLANQMSPDDSSSLIGESINVSGQAFDIIGIYQGDYSETSLAEIPLSTYHYYWKEGANKNLTITLTKDSSLSIVGQNIIDKLTSDGSMTQLGSYSSSSGAGAVDSISAMLQSLTLLISFVGAISLLISGVGVMNMIYTSVSERTKEIGIRRAMGATEGMIQRQFLMEGLTLTLVGGILGYIIGTALAFIISKLMGFTFVPDFYTAGLAVIISIVIGLMFSWFPARSATERDIVELVR